MSVKYLRMQASALEAKGDALYDKGQNERAQEFFRKSAELNKQADELESQEKVAQKNNAPAVQKKLFESDYEGLDVHDEFEIPTCEYCEETGTRRCEKCGNTYCHEHFPEHSRQISPEEWEEWDNLAFIPCETTPRNREWKRRIASNQTYLGGQWRDRL